MSAASAGPAGSRETRTLEVEGPAGDGGRNRARFVFGRRPGGAGGRLPDPGCGAPGVSLVGWLPAAAFAAFRDALRRRRAAAGPLRDPRRRRAATCAALGLGRAGAALVALARRPAQPAAAGAGDRRRGPSRCRSEPRAARSALRLDRAAGSRARWRPASSRAPRRRRRSSRRARRSASGRRDRPG